tara:strand:- start:7626 stop:8831 length:1206 start_codon:yes stop_codon:yes gene_type:complete
LPRQRTRITNSEGLELSARLDLPADSEAFAFALFAHCFTCTKNIRAISHISDALTREGIAVLRFDFTSLGESDFADTNFSSSVSDLVNAADWLGAHHHAPTILIGHSLGGAAVLQAAASIPTARAVATIGAPGDPAHVTHLLESSREKIESAGEAVVKLAGRPFRIKKQFLDDLQDQALTDTVSRLKRALLIFHSPIDNTVGIENASALYTAARHPKSFVSLDQADHLLSAEPDARYTGHVIAAWAQKYIDTPTPASPADHHEDEVVVHTGAEGYKTDIRAGNHGLVADEPVDVGGTDPYDYLLTSLGSCTGMTLRMYADRKKWPLEGVTVHLRHGRIHAEDCEDCKTKEGRVDVIRKTIAFEGPLSKDQKTRLLEIADRCPVHRTLSGEIRIETSQAAAI